MYYDYIATVVISLVIVAYNVSGNGVNLASCVETHIKKPSESYVLNSKVPVGFVEDGFLILLTVKIIEFAEFGYYKLLVLTYYPVYVHE